MKGQFETNILTDNSASVYKLQTMDQQEVMSKAKHLYEISKKQNIFKTTSYAHSIIWSHFAHIFTF